MQSGTQRMCVFLFTPFQPSNQIQYKLIEKCCSATDLPFSSSSLSPSQTSENDLPVCAPNAVCSKIDLYETPWIERQCRCPKQPYNKHYRTIYHAREVIKSNNNFRHVLEEKLKLASEADDSEYEDYESEHIKGLLHKLGVVYDADDVLADADAFSENRGAERKFDGSSNAVAPSPPAATSATKFRHSAHRDVARLGGCPSAIGDSDGHTITDKTRLYKLCEPVHSLPLCR